MQEIVPRIRLKGTRIEQKADLTVDPRLVVKPEGQTYLNKELSKGLYEVMTMQSMHALASQIICALREMMRMDYCEVHPMPHLSHRPHFKHDCSNCTFLGFYRDVDLYHCTQMTVPTLIARYADAPHMYISGAAFAAHTPEIWAAAILAEERGLGKFLEEKNIITLD